jgi:hypothetical protein
MLSGLWMSATKRASSYQRFGRSWTGSVSCRPAVAPAASVTRAVNVQSPSGASAETVPRISPSSDRERPGGSPPASTDHRYGGVPPPAVSRNGHERIARWGLRARIPSMSGSGSRSASAST